MASGKGSNHKRSLYEFAAMTSYHGSESVPEGVVSSVGHSLLGLESLPPTKLRANTMVAWSNNSDLEQPLLVYLEDFISTRAIKFTRFELLSSDMPRSFGSQFSMFYLPFDVHSELWARNLAVIAVAFMQHIFDLMKARTIDVHSSRMFVSTETTSMNTMDMLFEIIKTTAEVLSWIGLGNDYATSLELLEKSLTSVNSPDSTNKISVFSSIADTGFGLLVPLITHGTLLTPLLISEQDNVSIHPLVRDLLIGWKSETSQSPTSTGGCMWRFSEYPEPGGGGKYQLEYSMIDLFAFAFLRFLKQMTPEES